VAALLGGLPTGRYLFSSLAAETRQAARQAMGLPKPREEIDESWRRYRVQGIAASREALARAYREANPAMQRLLRYAGLDPERGLLRWGNHDRTLLLPSTIYEADDTGRSYRFRAKTQSIWLRNVGLKGSPPASFLVPDGPELAETIKGTLAIPVEESRQTTNSWGLRSPEPDLNAALRGIILGDSFMQGMLIGDDETPAESLRRYLETHLRSKVSILNTGHLGYSPEQYYHSLREFIDRFPPHFVVVSVYTNDFSGDNSDVSARGRGDWDEGKYWLDQIGQICRARARPCLFVPVPVEGHLVGLRKTRYYPGIIPDILELKGKEFLDPADDFINAHLELTIEQERRGGSSSGCLLFNDRIGDGHFSALGSQVWAASVGRRLIRLLQ
jgi:hypothetical protein